MDSSGSEDDYSPEVVRHELEPESDSPSFAPWVSIISNESQDMMDEDSSSEDGQDAAQGAANISMASQSSARINSHKHNQILQLLSQQAITMDRQRRELEVLREEYHQEMSRKTAQLRHAESHLHTARDERDKATTSLERMRADIAALKQRGSGSGTISLEEHKKLLQRVEDVAKNRTAIIEGEKGELVFHISKLRIELAQIKNQLEEQSFPDDIEAALTKKVLQAVRSSCIDILNEAEEAKKAREEVEEEIANVRLEMDMANASRDEAEERCESLEADYEELNSMLLSTQQRAAKTEAQMEDLREDLSNAEEHIESLGAQLAALERERDLALMDAEQLRAMSVESAHAVREAEEQQRELEREVERLTKTLAEAEAKSQKPVDTPGVNGHADVSDAVVDPSMAQKELEEATARLKEAQDEHIQLRKNIDDFEAEKKDIEENLAKLVFDNVTANDTISELKTKLEESEQRQHEGSRRQADLEPQLQQSGVKVRELEEAAKAMRRSLQEKEEKLQQSEVKVRELEEAENETRRSLQEKEEKLEEIVRGVQENEQRLRESERKVQEGEQRLHESERNLMDTERRLTASEERLQTCERELHDGHQKLEQMERVQQDRAHQMHQLEEKLQGREHDLQQTRDLAASLSTTEANLQKAIAAAEAKSSSLVDEMAKLKEGWMQGDDKRKELETERDSLKISVETLEVERAEATARVAKFEQQLDEAKSKLSEVELRNLQLQQECTKLTEEREIHKAAVGTLRESVRQLQVMLEKAKGEAEDGQRQIDELTKLRTAANASDAEMQANLERARAELEEAQAKLAEQSKQLSDNQRTAEKERMELEAQLSEAVKAKKDVEARLAEAEVKVVGREHKLKTSEAKVVEVSERNRGLSEANQKAREEIAGWRKEAHKLKESLTAAESKIVKLETARQRMAAIYGFPMNSPLPSPDRPYHAHLGHAPSSSPPMPHASLHNITANSQDSQGPPRKRARMSRASTLSMGGGDEAEPEGTSPARPITIEGSDRSASPATTAATVVLPQGQSQATQPVSSISVRNDKKRRSESFTSSSTSPHDGPTSGDMIRRLSLFVKLASWTTAEGLKVCGFCQLLNQHNPLEQRPPLSFDPTASPAEFLEHCRSTHAAFCGPAVGSLNIEVEHSRTLPTRRSQRVQKRGSDVTPSNLAPQGTKRKGKTATPALASTAGKASSSASFGPSTSLFATPSPNEAKKELFEAFTKMSAWRTDDGDFICGLCELEGKQEGQRALGPLQFDPFATPDLFMGHCRQEHPEFWMPHIRSSVEMIPSDIL